MCRRAVLTLLLSCWLAAPAWAATTQSIIAGQTDPSDTTGTNYAPLLGSSVIALSGTEAHFQQMVSTGGTLSALRVELDADPAGVFAAVMLMFTRWPALTASLLLRSEQVVLPALTAHVRFPLPPSMRTRMV